MTPQALVDKLLQEGIRLGALKKRLRAVTHLDVSRQDIEDTLEVMHKLLR